MKRYLYAFTLLSLAPLFLIGCGKQAEASEAETCAPHYITVLPSDLTAPTPRPETSPPTVKIRGKSIIMDNVVEGPLCNDTWSGTVYVACNIQVYPWEENPTFLQNCNLNIEPGTVVYVAYHNDTAYYNGCSCHTGKVAGP